MASAAAEAEIDDLGYFPIYTHAPSDRTAALEAALRGAQVIIGLLPRPDGLCPEVTAALDAREAAIARALNHKEPE